MALTETAVKAKWPSVKNELKRNWSKLSDEELEKTGADSSRICSLIVQKYGGNEENYTERVEEVFHRFESRQEEFEEEEDTEDIEDIEEEDVEEGISSRRRTGGGMEEENERRI